MRVKSLFILIIIMFLQGCVFIESPTIEDVVYEDFYIYWTDIDASRYEVTISDVTYDLTKPSLDVSHLLSDTYIIEIEAFDENRSIHKKQFEVDIDHMLYYEVVSNIEIELGLITFDPVFDAMSYDVWINEEIYKVNETSLMIPNYKKDMYYQIRVKANHISGGRYSRSVLYHTFNEIDIHTYVIDPLDGNTYTLSFDKNIDDIVFEHHYESDFYQKESDANTFDLTNWIDEDVLDIYLYYEDIDMNHLVHFIIKDMNISYLIGSNEVTYDGDDISFEFHLTEGSELVVENIEFSINDNVMTIDKETINSYFEDSESSVMIVTYYIDDINRIIGFLFIEKS